LPEWLIDLIVGTQLQSIRIEHRTFRNDDLKSLLNCRSLGKIEIFDCDIGGNEYTSATLEFSGDLTIVQSRFEPDFLPTFGPAQHIRLLGSVISEKQVIAICNTSNQLRSFVCDEPIATMALEHLVGMPKLTLLDLRGQSFSELNKRSDASSRYRITTLILHDCYPENDVATFVSQCTTLKRISLEGVCATQATVLSLLTSEATLKEVLIAGPLIMDDSLSILGRLPKLQTLMIRDTSISRESFDEFATQFTGKIIGAPSL
jgi:hypothetical protein